MSEYFLLFLTLEVAMSDGPHRSLKMPRGWKKLAKRADNKAYAPEEVRDALPEALEHDWRAEVPDSVCKRVRDILGDNQSSLFGHQRAERLETLRGETAGYVLGNAFLDYAIEEAARGRCGDDGLRVAAGRALMDRAARGARQVEEHYCRESTLHRAAHVRERIDIGVTQSDIHGIAGQLVGTDISERSRPAKQAGLDDGVRL